jgi:hypothetical protein
MSSTCQNGNDSHFYITIKNQSDKDMILAYTSHYKGMCALSRKEIIEKNSVFEYRPYNWSIERVLGRGSETVLELYFVNPDKFNEPADLYDCDSIPIKNDILRHYKLTLEDLERSNFTITYP